MKAGTLTFVLILSLVPLLASAQVGPLIRIDSNYGNRPAITFDANGNAIVLYSEESGEHRILGNRFNGLTPTTEFPVNTTAGDANHDATLTTFPDGGWVAGWTNLTGGWDTSYFRRFDHTGLPLGDDVEIPLTFGTDNPLVCGIATSPSGPFDIYWYYWGACGPGSCNQTWGEAFDSAGVFLSHKSFIGGTYAEPAAIGSNAAGDVVAVYGYYPGNFELRYRIGTVGSALGSSTLLVALDPISGYYYLYDVATAPSGAFVIVWWDVFNGTHRLRAERFDDQGNAVGNAFNVFETTTAALHPTKVACRAGGDFLVVWLEDTGAFAAHVSPLDVISGPYPLNGSLDVATGLDVAASPPGGIYAVVFDNNEYIDGQWHRKVWMCTFTPDEAVGVVTTPMPTLRLDQNVPNPFNPSTTIAYSIAQAGRVRVDVYDASGARVAGLVDDVLGAGPHETRWDGIDAAGRRVVSGVYFCVLRTGGHVVTRKMALLK